MRVAIFALALATLFSNGAKAETLFSTTTPLVSSVPITPGGVYNKQVLYSVCPTVPAGNEVDVRFQALVTNATGYNVNLAYQLIRGATSADTSGTVLGGTGSTTILGTQTNFPFDSSSIDTAPGSAPCYNVVAWAQSGYTSGSLSVPSGYGIISISVRQTSSPNVLTTTTLSSTIPVTPTAGAKPMVAYSTCYTGASGVMDIRYQAQILSSLSFNVGLGWNVIRATTSSDTSGVVVSPVASSNDTNAIWGRVLTGLFVDPTPPSSGCYNLIVYAYSSACGTDPTCGGATVTLQSGYGSMQIEARSSDKTTTHFGAAAKQIFLTDYSTASTTVIDSLCMFGLANKIVDVRFQSEVTNDVGYNSTFGWYLIRASAPNSTTGTLLSANQNIIITTDVHHYVVDGSGMESSTSDYGCYNLVGFAQGSTFPSGANLTVEAPNYALLSVSTR